MVTAIVTILIFLILISLHEFGHFIMAKAVGVPVLEFAIGMGPAIFKKKGKETLYSLRIFPIGGYCKLEGEDSDTDSPDGFANQKLWKRFLVVSAGAILNIILGFCLFMVIVGLSGPFKSNVVSSVDERSYIYTDGLEPGDRIISINGNKVRFYQDISLYTSEFIDGENFVLEIIRDGQKYETISTPSKNITTYTYGEDYVDVEDEINGVTETKRYEGEQIPAEYVGKTESVTRFIIGFIPKTQEVTAGNIIPQAWNYTLFVTKSIYKALFELFTGKSGLDNVSGPIGVVTVVDDAVNSGSGAVLNVLFIMAMLTLNLGIFNLLPLPALDGGRLFFMLIELVRGKPIPPEKEGIVHAIGLMLLLGLTVVIFYNDIMKIFG